METPSTFFRRTKQAARNSCFVLMPFEEGMSAVYEHGIKPLVEDLGIACRRADEIYSSQSVLADIWGVIQESEFVIADLTGKNPNVMYELGLCHVLWKRVILMCQNKDDVPFDLRAWRVIWYDFTFAGAARLKEELQRAIEALREEGEAVESTPVASTVPSTPRTQVPDHPPEAPRPESEQWLHGEVGRWDDQKGFGFVRVGEEEFFLHLSGLFSERMLPVAGAKVTFLPLEPRLGTPNRRAVKVFVHGTRLGGRVARFVEDKRYAFVDLEGQRGSTHSLFVHVPQGVAPSRGSEIEVVISANRQGPIGELDAPIDPGQGGCEETTPQEDV